MEETGFSRTICQRIDNEQRFNRCFQHDKLSLLQPSTPSAERVPKLQHHARKRIIKIFKIRVKRQGTNVLEGTRNETALRTKELDEQLCYLTKIFMSLGSFIGITRQCR